MIKELYLIRVQDGHPKRVEVPQAISRR